MLTGQRVVVHEPKSFLGREVPPEGKGIVCAFLVAASSDSVHEGQFIVVQMDDGRFFFADPSWIRVEAPGGVTV